MVRRRRNLPGFLSFGVVFFIPRGFFVVESMYRRVRRVLGVPYNSGVCPIKMICVFTAPYVTYKKNFFYTVLRYHGRQQKKYGRWFFFYSNFGHVLCIEIVFVRRHSKDQKRCAPRVLFKTEQHNIPNAVGDIPPFAHNTKSDFKNTSMP